MLKRSHSASIQFSTPSSFLHLFYFFSFLASALFCFSTSFLFSFGAPLSASASLSFLQPSLFLFFRRVALFSTQNTFLAQNVFQPKILFQPKNLSLFVVQRLLLFVSFQHTFVFFFFSSSFSFLPLATTYCPFSAQVLSLKRVAFFSFSFSAFYFSAQNNSLFSPKPFSVQPKTFFFCVCLLLFYLNKSSFSSNLQ